MKVQKANLKDGAINFTHTKVINHAELTGECWSIQFWGLSACESCQYLDTNQCGGKRIRKLIRDGEFPRGGLPDHGKKI